MKKCWKCNASLEDSYLFCHRCGVNLQVPRCEACSGELPENAIFCPWCGKPLAEEKKSDDPPVKQMGAVQRGTQERESEPVFSEEHQAFFRKLLENHFEDGEISCSSERILWEDSYTGWGAIDDTSWEDTTLFIIKPLSPDEKSRYKGNSATPKRQKGEMKSIFREIVENSDGCIFYEALSAHRSGKYLNIHWKDTLVVSNPYGVGMDVIFVYESHDDKD